MNRPLATPRAVGNPPKSDDRTRPTTSHGHDAAPAICRICRGEGTTAEPLFFPCKCSGSIKYVHQDCLMEWLSHSQKKHCELCKTSFRFTKLYAPDMPKSLPVHVFMEHMARFVMRNLLLWLRAIVTISVWVCWLPYFMRAVWHFMFWISDEGLGAGSLLSRSNLTGHAMSAADVFDDTGACPSSPLVPSTTTSASAATAMVNAFKEQLSDRVLRVLLGSLSKATPLSPEDFQDAGDNATTLPGMSSSGSSPSLLSNVSFLRTLTRSDTLNRTIVTVLEGQIITVLVIVCFILVILVRDYVVQQQPEINMRAAFADQENNIPVVQVPPNAHGPAGAGQDSDDAASDDDETATVERASDQPNNDNDVLLGPSGTAEASHDLPLLQDEGSSHPLSRGPSHSPMERSVSDRGSQERGGAADYFRIYRLADGDPATILQQIEEEGLEEQMTYWVDVTRKLLKKQEDAGKSLQLEAEASMTQETPAGPSVSIPAMTHHLDDFGRPTPDLDQGAAAADASAGKGKEREWLPPSPGLSPLPSGTDDFASGSARERAASEGVDSSQTPNPLANNNWSFANIAAIDDKAANGSVDVSGAEFHTDDETAIQNRDTAEVPASLDDVVATQAIQDEPGNEEPGDRGLAGRVADFMWGDLEHHREIELQEEIQAVEDGAAEDPWVDVPVGPAGEENPDEAAMDGEPGVDGMGLDAEADAIDDLEDFEGVMELLGMRGPIAGLFQNAIFCAVLVSVTIFVCIFVPYNIGRVAVWVVANPVQLVKMAIELSKVVQDTAIVAGGLFSWCALNIVDMFTGVVGGTVGAHVVAARKASWGLWTGAGSRVVDYAFMEFPLSASEMQNFSAISHEALNTVKSTVGWAALQIEDGFVALSTADLTAVVDGRATSAVLSASRSLVAAAGTAVAMLTDPTTWVIDLRVEEARPPVDPSLAYWSGLDRFWAIVAGYITVFTVGALYLKRGSPFSRGDIMQAWEAGVIDTLHQASGIMKVILIISIEMLVFPLYCGLLLDVALMPLFEDTTFKSRIMFSYNYPLTSIFVHWFVGTGYMFHFALFVSMCRKIMRPGVLYFIRDPDDPEFHPVRDVLERNLTTQLRKILFSAFVYGALVIVCLGGVVWGLSAALPGVLPVHYSSNEPVLEFPVDLLFYNFLIPLAVKFFKPSDGLHAMYTWWFRKCARGLRLTYFLFGERRIDEEGVLQLPASQTSTPPHKAMLLELDESENSVVPKTWRDTFDGGHAKPNTTISSREMREMRHRKAHLVKTEQLVKSGRFVRAPASDRVKIPKGQDVFLTVSERGHRKDGKPDTDLYASPQYQLVYTPPRFRMRVFLFILFIWMFAAVTGVGFTIAPLVLGRTIFKTLIPAHIRTNDIYAFSIGVYVLGTLTYLSIRLGHVVGKVQGWAGKVSGEVSRGHSASRITGWLGCGMELLYAYSFVMVVFPLTISALMELYVSIPLHTYMSPPKAEGGREDERHTVRVIQAWTLGLLYMNLATRMISSLFPDSRPAIAVRSVMRRGFLKPDIRVLTKAFIVPCLTLAGVAMFAPPVAAGQLIRHGAFGDSPLDDVTVSLIYRYAYPAAALSAVVVRYAVGLTRVFKRWTAGIRDEAYLIGERLHNFGAATAGSRKAKRAWGAGGARL